MADGSVRFVSEGANKVKPSIWKLLTSRNDGNPIPEY